MKRYSLLRKLKNLKNVCIIVHLDPDTDALCSAVVFRNFLLHSFGVKNVDIFTEYGVMPENYLPIIEGVEINPQQKEYDASIMMDSSSLERLGKYAEVFNSAKYKVNIDHHATNTKPADVNIVDITSSACEVVFNILKEFKYKFTKQDYGKIYAGIITDTNNFSVGAINEGTFTISGECYKNIDAAKIYNNFLANNSLINMKMLALSVKNLKVFDDGKIMISYITQEESYLYNSRPEDYMGVVNKLQTITGCKFTCFIYPKDESYYVSMRCKDIYNVGEVAKSFGGGGHKCAAAFLATKTIDETINDLLPIFEKQIKETPEKTDAVF